MSTNQKQTLMSAAGYFKDSGKVISTTTNPGMLARAKLLEQSAEIELNSSITCGKKNNLSLNANLYIYIIYNSYNILKVNVWFQVCSRPHGICHQAVK